MAAERMEPDDPSKDDELLRQAILDYLKENPDAMESVSGIAEWWIARSRIRVALEAVTRVLKGLTENGLLTEIQIKGETYCRLAKKDVN
jgi:Fe2+ or Zn2+ uptake regulation protein